MMVLQEDMRLCFLTLSWMINPTMPTADSVPMKMNANVDVSIISDLADVFICFT